MLKEFTASFKRLAINGITDMATLREIRSRISGVKKTQKITKAMKMVAAAKLRRAQNGGACRAPVRRGR